MKLRKYESETEKFEGKTSEMWTIFSEHERKRFEGKALKEPRNHEKKSFELNCKRKNLLKKRNVYNQKSTLI